MALHTSRAGYKGGKLVESVVYLGKKRLKHKGLFFNIKVVDICIVVYKIQFERFFYLNIISLCIIRLFEWSWKIRR